MQNFNIMLLSLLVAQVGASSDSTISSVPRPTVFQASEGDRWLLLGSKSLIFKVDPISTGSNTLVVGTEVMPPGNRIPTHKHLNEDEAVFVHDGVVWIALAGHQYEARSGATVFIPRGTWIGIENRSKANATIVFIFNKPAFERCLRAMSSRQGKKFTMPAPEEMAAMRRQCDEVVQTS
jgi:quercetin dioxygenase-like cupin family protein